MSWDVFAQDLPAGARTVDDIPADFVPGSIGTRSEIIRQIKDVVPFADFSNPAWGNIEGEGFSIAVSTSDDEEVECVAFFVRGNDRAAGIISEILTRLNLRARDSGTGDFFNHVQASEGLKHWRQYRDAMISKFGGGENA
jgi:hypothetical protein